MSKKILSAILTVAMLAALFCVSAVSVSADEDTYAVGSQVEYTFTIGGASNVGGITQNLTYDDEYLSYSSYDVSSVATSYAAVATVNAEKSGRVLWSITFDPITGADFTESTDVITFNFEVVKEGTLSDFAFSSEIRELFDTSYDTTTLLTSSVIDEKVTVVPAVDTDAASDTDEPASDTDEPASDTDEPASDTDEPASDTDEPASDTDEPASDTDEPATDSDKPSTDSEGTSSNDSSSTSSSDSDSNSNASSATPDNASSKTNNSSKAGTTSNGTNASTVQTAGTVAVISLVVILMVAGAIVLFTKKKAL